MTDTGNPAGQGEPNESSSQAAPSEPQVQPTTAQPSPASHTRTSGYWASVVVGLVVLLVLLVFILENGQTARVAFFGLHGHLPQGVALLFAAVIGGLFVVLAGAARILQLRLRARGPRPAQRGAHRTRRTGPRREAPERPEPAGAPPPA
ncbi:MAG TPA: lipopolysaccharide assembly protein LapA domain-containing protein [Acidimicrobiales bacterium]|nr:lipopolysaccharide assembly protein LapA domain-containing protein [Acidimicrobiales bacterium]